MYRHRECVFRLDEPQKSYDNYPRMQTLKEGYARDLLNFFVLQINFLRITEGAEGASIEKYGNSQAKGSYPDRTLEQHILFKIIKIDRFIPRFCSEVSDVG